MDRKMDYSGFGPLKILKDELIRNDIIHSLRDYLSGNISPLIFTPNLFLPGTNILKFKYEIMN